MKKILLILSLAVSVLLTACGSGFDQQEADRLVDKIRKAEAFSQDDYASAIRLLGESNRISFDKLMDGDFIDKESLVKLTKELSNDDDFRKMSEASMHISGFVMNHTQDLDEDNAKAFCEYENELDEQSEVLRQKFK